MNIKELRKRFKDIEDADLIIQNELNISKTELILGEAQIKNKELERIFKKIERLKNNEPIQYILEKTEFMSLEFEVNPSVLIPRADTEILVEAVIKRADEYNRILDIGCGSGCIGISLAHYLKNARISLLDISKEALKTAKRNAEKNGVLERVDFLHCDILKKVPDMLFDCVVSNPPYIKNAVIKTLDEKVREFEPLNALSGGDDGLVFYNRIAECAPVKSGGLLAFEIGYDQKDAVCKILLNNGYKEIVALKDIEKRDRVVLGYKMP